jgi:hypothetical protein
MKKTYFLTNAMLILLFSTANAQIVYTDIIPDVTTTLNSTTGFVSNVVPIDFDGDNTEEYNFRWDDWGAAGWFMHMTFGTNELNLKGTATNPFGGRYIEPMTLNTSISSSSNWGNSIPEPFIGDQADPNFQNLGDRYVGCKFTLGANTHYGWVRLSFDGNKTLTIRDYAYETTPNTEIISGNMGTTTGISDIDKNNINFSIYPNPAKSTITIENKSELNISKIKIVDLLGKEVKVITVSNSDKQIIDISNLKRGIYLVNIFNQNKQVGYKKITIVEE